MCKKISYIDKNKAKAFTDNWLETFSLVSDS